MPIKIAAIADTHYKHGNLGSCGKRRTAIADILLLRAVHRLNRFIKPDITLLLGDLVDDGAVEGLRKLKQTVDLLESPIIAIPGNHDGGGDVFYSVFPRPDDVIDIGGIRFVTFIDADEPHYNSHRSVADVKRMSSATFGHDGPIISVQHVPLFPTGSSPCPYQLLNANEVWDAFEQKNYTLSISGHYHAGDDLYSRGAGKAAIVPALCESPFAFFEITIDGDKVDIRRHELKMPPELGLIDYHVHTPFAYCQQNMDMAISIALAEELGLAGLSFSEHSGQLYFDAKTFWSASFMRDGIRTVEGTDNRMHDYLQQARQFNPPVRVGLEVDCDYSGNPVVRPEDWEQTQVHIGAIHWLEELRKPEPNLELAGREMLSRLERFTECGIQALAHPFRVFNRSKSGLPDGLMPRVVDLLHKHEIAAEVNFHTQETDGEFVKQCVESGVKLTFGSDAHNLYEVGEFFPHLELISRCGYNTSDLPEILAQGGSL